MKSAHEYFMRQALAEALKAKGNTSPNPLVGAVLVKNNRIIARGYHKKAGLDHAEVEVLKNSLPAAKGATLYVTLEPCCFFGRTPPCTEAIKRVEIKKVIIGMRDPNPKNNGRGIKALRQAGIKVTQGVLRNEAEKINQPFIKYITQGLPLVVVKVGQSLDGRIATRTGESKWITSSDSRRYGRNLRADFDAIMVGINTVIADNPRLNPARRKQRFFKIIIDPNLQIPLKARLLSGWAERVYIATKLNPPLAKAKELERRGVRLLKIPDKNHKLNLQVLLKRLAKLEITSVLVEGGGNLIGSLFDQHLVDKILFFVAPKIIGGKQAISSVMAEGIGSIQDIINLKDLEVKRIGADYLFAGAVK